MPMPQRILGSGAGTKPRWHSKGDECGAGSTPGASEGGDCGNGDCGDGPAATWIAPTEGEGEAE